MEFLEGLAVKVEEAKVKGQSTVNVCDAAVGRGECSMVIREW